MSDNVTAGGSYSAEDAAARAKKLQQAKEKEAAKARTPEQIKKDIELTRQQLTTTVDELSGRVDPRIKVSEAKTQAADIATAVTQGLQSGKTNLIEIAISAD